MRERAMKELYYVLLRHENEAEREWKGFLFHQGQLPHVDFIMKWKTAW